MSKLWSRREDERGAVLVMAVAGVVLAMIAAALSIDLGRLAQTKRFDQKVADLAALDAVRAVSTPSPNALERARSSATRNNFSYSTSDWGLSGKELNVCWGTWSPASLLLPGFQQNTLGCSYPPTLLFPGQAKAVRVSVESPYKALFPYVVGPDVIGASGIATETGVVSTTTTTTTAPPPTTTIPPVPMAGFTIGSSLVNLSTSSSTLLNPIIGGWLGGTLGLSLVSWQGLTAANVTLDQLRAELGVATVNELLTTEFTVGRILTATAHALRNNGDAAHADILLNAAGTAGLVLNITNTTKIKLGDLITVASGAENAALASTLNAFQLVTASAEAANGNSFLTIPNAGITVPNVTNTSITLKVIEPPKWYYGPTGGSVTTGQVDITVTPTINLNVSVSGTLGLSVLNVQNALPVKLQAASATGTLTSIACSGGVGQGITVTVDPEAFHGDAAVTTLRVRLLGLPILDIQTTSATAAVDGSASPLSFAYPGDFKPPSTSPTSKHVGSQPIGLQQKTTFTSGTATVLGILPLGVTTAQIVSAVMATLNPLIGNVDNNVLTPLLTALGLDIGGADVTAVGPIQNCAAPPVSTTTTLPPPTTTTTSTTTTLPQPKLVQ